MQSALAALDAYAAANGPIDTSPTAVHSDGCRHDPRPSAANGGQPYAAQQYAPESYAAQQYAPPQTYAAQPDAPQPYVAPPVPAAQPPAPTFNQPGQYRPPSP